MSKTRMMYFEKDDVLHLAISDEPEAGSVELSPNITVELNDKGEMIGLEILEASRFIRDSIMESAQGTREEANQPAGRPVSGPTEAWDTGTSVNDWICSTYARAARGRSAKRRAAPMSSCQPGSSM